MGGRYFSSGDAVLFYTIDGQGPPILLLHGWACDQLDWSFQVPFLHRLGFQTIALDHHGHGRSEYSESKACDLKSLARDAFALLDHLGIQNVLIMGHSMGAMVASVMAVEKPEQIKAIVLVDPVYHRPGAVFDSRQSSFTQDTCHEITVTIFNQLYTSQTPEWIKIWHKYRLWGVSPKVVLDCYYGMFGPGGIGRRENALPFMERRACPRLVTCADTEKAEFEREIGVLGDIDEIILLGEGHWHHQQCPEHFNRILEEWLRRQELLPQPFNACEAREETKV
ncbi:hypothetical protein G7054_g8456 [Neopestalotiopsis clavispora]|nr:hypothetical protein G7054_g8456 [Neopestalotiopsis clavispora]